MCLSPIALGAAVGEVVARERVPELEAVLRLDLGAGFVPVPDCLSILLNPHDPNALFTRQTLNHRKFGGVAM